MTTKSAVFGLVFATLLGALIPSRLGPASR